MEKDEPKKYGFMKSEMPPRVGPIQPAKLFWAPPKCIQKKRIAPKSELGNRLPLGINDQ